MDEDVEYHTLLGTFHGYIGICPKCYDPVWYLDDKLISQDGHLAELAMDKRRNEKEGKELDKVKYQLKCGCSIGHWDDIIMVDEAIAHPVIILNQMGYRTTNSCSGHPYGPGAMYLTFDNAYLDIKKAYTMLTKDQKEMMKLEKWMPGENGGTDVYVLSSFADCAFVYDRTIDSRDTKNENYRLVFDRKSVMKEWEEELFSDTNKWAFNWGETSVNSVAVYGNMAPTVEFISCLYAIIQGCISVNH